MAGLSLNSLTENASRLGARIQESLQEHTRDLGAKDYFDAPEEKIKQIRTQLDSNSDREKLDGLKRLIAVCTPFVLLQPQSMAILKGSHKAHLQRPQRFRILSLCCQERRVTKSGDSQARLYILATLRPRRTRLSAPLHQLISARPSGPKPANKGDGAEGTEWD